MPVPHETWTVDAVCEYLRTLKLGAYTFNEHVDSFRSEIINGKLFLNLEKNDLNVLGVYQFAKRNKLYQHIQQLKSPQQLRQTEPAAVLKSPPHIMRTPPDNKNQTQTLNIFKQTPNNSDAINLTSPVTITPPVRSPAPSAAPNIFSFLPPINTDGHFSFQPLNVAVPQASSSMSQLLPAPFPAPGSPLFRAFSPNRALSIPTPSNILTPHMVSTTFFEFAQQQQRQQQQQPPPSTLCTPNAPAASQSVHLLSNAVNELTIGEPQKNYTNNRLVHEIMGIHHGMNAQNTLFILMTQTATSMLNQLYKEYDIMDLHRGGLKRRAVSNPLQTFQCADNVVHEKKQYGWTVRDARSHEQYRLPFNALCRFTVDLVSNQVTQICPVFVSGKVNHINKFKAAWITCDVQIQAIEEVRDAAIETQKLLVSNIVSVDITNMSDTSLQHRDSSYMVHDPEHQDDYQLHKGLAVQCCLKLSTRTNRKQSSRQKPVFVQVWNVKPWQRVN
mmetsp:Transcript_26726/g.43737  ORF Transcript_26726/g.43737 Transcript_26726/m.43737 type:complete len:500 (-) Transcript_26726:439-1938(-)